MPQNWGLFGSHGAKGRKKKKTLRPPDFRSFYSSTLLTFTDGSKPVFLCFGKKFQTAQRLSVCGTKPVLSLHKRDVSRVQNNLGSDIGKPMFTFLPAKKKIRPFSTKVDEQDELL